MALIVLGGLIPLVVAFSLGKLCLPHAPDVIGFGIGAVIESVLVFGLLVAGVAQPAAFVALGAVCILPLVWLRPRLCIPLPAGLPAIVLGIYAALYLVHALAPEIQPDGMSYHLGLVSEYARLGAFPDRVGFYEMLPQGMEMLYLFAFVIGKHSAAKLVHFGFLLATVPLIVELGRRARLPDYLSSSVAAFYFCAPVVGVTGTSTYNDAALVFFTLAVLLALVLGDGYLLPAGLLAGFCYAIKMTGLLVPLLAAGFVLPGRRIRPLAILALAALVPIVPWMIRNAAAAGNPIAPLGNSIFPTQYFHRTMESNLAESWRSYEGFTLRTAPWELSVGEKLQGTYGPIFLLLPLGLLALRHPIGRWAWLAAVLLAIPWFSNAGARFLMQSLPFLALALAMSLGRLARPVLWICLGLHAVTCWPSVAAMYRSPDAWRLRELPWRAALRLESEHDYLQRAVGEYPLVDLLLEQTRPGETTFALMGVPNAYIDRPIVDWWQSALADRILGTLKSATIYAGAPFFDLRAEWPAEPLQGLRFRLSARLPAEWDLTEVRLYSESDRVFNSPQWLLNSWPNPWEAPMAFDDNFASSWRTWESMRPGMFLEVLFDRPQRLTSAIVASHMPVYNLPVEVYGLRTNGSWKLLSDHPERFLRPKEDLRRSAMRYLKRSGIDYILAPEATDGVWQMGKILVEQQHDWGLEEVGSRGSVHLLRIAQ